MNTQELNKIASMLSCRIKADYDKKYFYDIFIEIHEMITSICTKHDFQVVIPELINYDMSDFYVKIPIQDKGIINIEFLFTYNDYPAPECCLKISSDKLHVVSDIRNIDVASIKFVLESKINNILNKN